MAELGLSLLRLAGLCSARLGFIRLDRTNVTSAKLDPVQLGWVWVGRQRAQVGSVGMSSVEIDWHKLISALLK